MDEISTPDYEFEGFRLDTTLQVLVSPAGEPIPLPSRAFETLRCLVERAGELVERPALMKAVWPRAVVEDNNLTQCILTLRRAFGEEAGERRFILTVPGRGFKFVAPVRVVARMRQRSVATPPPPQLDRDVPEPAPAPPAATPAAARQTDQHRGRRHRMAIAVALSLVVAIALAAWLVLRVAPAPTSPAEYAPLTDVTDSATAPALSPDGHFLAFIRGGTPFLSSGQVWLKQLPDGELVQLTHATGPIFAPTFTADGTRLAYTAIANSSSWDTWTVPITGGEPTRLLPNASGLTFIGPHEVMYSEFKTGIHLGIVTSRDDRSGHRDIYLPSHERAMAHYAHLSPDRKSVLVVEMGRSADWQRCRLVPFDGSSPGGPVGPSGACLSAAWSPDGKWMYFAAYSDHHSHLWRQPFPDGVPQQLTFGPTDEETVAASPDGRSLLTSLGQARSELWLHDASGERALTTEGAVSAPWLSADARRVYFLTVRSSLDPWSLARLDIASGRREAMLDGFAVDGYEISHDERQVVFTTTRGGVSEIWIASLDRHEPPRLLVRGGDEVAFDHEGRVYFRHLGESANYLHRVRLDGQGEERVLDAPIIEFNAVSPDGNWVVVDLPFAGTLAGAFLAPVHGGAPRLITDGWWPSRWSRDGKMLYLEVGEGENSKREGRTAVLPFGADGSSIDFARAASAASTLIPHAEQELSIGSDPSEYVYVRRENRRNIYRIPVH
jgi:DNA-binding winged helix-turn-helix (wHTH) protein/Tol biopolymer transport system component